MNACSVHLSSVCQDISVLFHSSFSINHVLRCSSSYAENKLEQTFINPTQFFSEFMTSSTFPLAFWQVGWFVCQQSPGDAWLQGWSQPESFRHLWVHFVTLDQTSIENSGLRPSRRKRPQRSPKRSGRAHKAQKHAESQHLRTVQNKGCGREPFKISQQIDDIYNIRGRHTDLLLLVKVSAVVALTSWQRILTSNVLKGLRWSFNPTKIYKLPYFKQ